MPYGDGGLELKDSNIEIQWLQITLTDLGKMYNMCFSEQYAKTFKYEIMLLRMSYKSRIYFWHHISKLVESCFRDYFTVLLLFSLLGAWKGIMFMQRYIKSLTDHWTTLEYVQNSNYSLLNGMWLNHYNEVREKWATMTLRSYKSVCAIGRAGFLDIPKVL